MRIRLLLVPKTPKCVFPINYQYPLSVGIYKILSHPCPKYQAFLQAHRLLERSNQPLRFFTFSRLWCSALNRDDTSLIVKNYAHCRLLITIPFLEKFNKNFVLQLFKNRELEIFGPYSVGKFKIILAEPISDPRFSPFDHFKCLSPIVLTTLHVYHNKLTTYYLRPDDERLGKAIRYNLIQKYEILYQKTPRDNRLDFFLDRDYIKRKGGHQNLSKLITINEGNNRQETKVKAFIAPFTLAGSEELMQIAYECGIGDKNSLGFGMIEKVRSVALPEKTAFAESGDFAESFA